MSLAPAHLSELFGRLERVKQAVKCSVPAEGDGEGRHWLVVVAHGDEHDEQGSVMVVRDFRGELEITDVLAVTAGFRVSVGQHDAEPGESAVEGTSELTVVFESSRARIRLTCSDSDDVRKVVSEVKLLAVIANENRFRDGASHSWLEPHIRQGSQGSSKGAQAQATSVKTNQGWFWSRDNATPSTVDDKETGNPLDPSFRTVQWLQKKLGAREGDFSQRKPLRIHLATYNVNDLLPRDEDDLRGVIGVQRASEQSDLIVVGLQEVDLRNQSLILSATSERDDAWIAAFFKAMGPEADNYELLCTNKFVGVLQIIFVKKTVRSQVSSIDMCEKPIGLLGLMGNKAGVAARMKIHDSTFCFVTAHLAAFGSADDKRRENYEELMRGLTFSRAESDTPAFDGPGQGTTATPGDSDYLFFLGDLNFRIALPDEQVHQLVDKEDWQGMLKCDQLRAQIAAGKAFAGFQEGEITFRPSFKYKHGTLDIDKKRGAAFTDRVVWRTHSERDAVMSTSYTSHPEVLLSDHLPVSASATCQVLSVDEDRRRAVYAEILDELANLRKEYTPALNCQPDSLDFGHVHAGEALVLPVTLVNTGSRAPVDFNISSASGDTIFWASPSRGKLSPGDSKVVKVNLRVTTAHVDSLNRGILNLEDSMRVSVTGGEPQTVAARARHLPTCFGASLEWLSRLNGPARVGRMISETETPLTSPRELWRMIEVLMQHGKESKGLFVERGSHELERLIKNAIDEGEPLAGSLSSPEATVAVGDLLVQFLESLAEPVIPSQQHEACTSATTRDEAYACLDLLPHINTNVLISITALLRFLLEGKVPGGRLDDYAAIFAGCLFRSSSGSTAEQITNRRQFIKLLIDL